VNAAVNRGRSPPVNAAVNRGRSPPARGSRGRVSELVGPYRLADGQRGTSPVKSEHAWTLNPGRGWVRSLSPPQGRHIHRPVPYRPVKEPRESDKTNKSEPAPTHPQPEPPSDSGPVPSLELPTSPAGGAAVERVSRYNRVPLRYERMLLTEAKTKPRSSASLAPILVQGKTLDERLRARALADAADHMYKLLHGSSATPPPRHLEEYLGDFTSHQRPHSAPTEGEFGGTFSHAQLS